MKEINIFKIKLHPFTKKDFLKIIEFNLKVGNQITQNGINAASINEIIKNKELIQAYNNSDLNNIDGMSMVWALRFLGYSVPERVSCPDLAELVLKLSEENQLRVYFFGSSQQNLQLAINNLREAFPKLIIAGFRNGYFEVSEEELIIEEINASKPDILFLGMPTPKKEFFMKNHKHQLEIKYSLGVGGLFDIFSGKTKRAPKWMQKHGFEWFYRLIQEPRRMWKRYLFGNSKFIYLILKEKIKQITTHKN